MSVDTSEIVKSLGNGQRRRVSIRRDDDDFVVAFQPEDEIVFRHQDAGALRKVCHKLRWLIIDDQSVPDNLPDLRADLSGLG